MGYSTPYVASVVGTTGRGPSFDLWVDCPWADISNNPTLGIQFWDEFLNVPTLSADSNTTGYASYIDTSNTILQAATAGGVVELTTDATDNDAPVLQAGGGTGGSFQITTATAGKLWFEARIQISTIVESAVFVGLGAPNVTADNGVHTDNSGVLVTTAAFIGFNAPAHASVSTFGAMHAKASGTVIEAVASVHTTVNDTWVKLGFKFDPDTDQITWYVNGTAHATTTDVSAAGSTDFPAGVLMSPVFALKNGEAGAKVARMDWWRVAQLL